MCKPPRPCCKNSVLEVFGPIPKKPKIGKPLRISFPKRFLYGFGPRPKEPPIGKPRRTSSKTNGFPGELLSSGMRLARGRGSRGGADALALPWMSVLPRLEQCIRAAFARRRASQNGINFRSADGHSNARILQVMRFFVASGTSGRRNHSSSHHAVQEYMVGHGSRLRVRGQTEPRQEPRPCRRRTSQAPPRAARLECFFFSGGPSLKNTIAPLRKFPQFRHRARRGHLEWRARKKTCGGRGRMGARWRGRSPRADSALHPVWPSGPGTM